MTEDKQRSENPSPELRPEKEYAKFLLAEYNNIAKALFNTGTGITRFFQFYLLILTIPITLAGAIVKDYSDVRHLLGSPVAPLLALPLFVIALVGFCVMAYVTNLRMDVILYSRTVNGIRRHFANRSGLPLDHLQTTLALPRTIDRPSYAEATFFIWVVGAFALMNSVYVYAAAWLKFQCGSTIALLFFVLHFLVYFGLAWHRQHCYLK